MNEDDAACIFSCIILNRPDLMEEINEKWESILPQNLYYEDLFTPEEEAEVTKKIWEFYFRGEPVSLDTRDNLTNMYTDGMFTYITQRPALDTAARGKSNPVFLYQYAYHGPESLLGTYLNGTEKESNRKEALHYKYVDNVKTKYGELKNYFAYICSGWPRR